jgi:hypothetical protein
MSAAFNLPPNPVPGQIATLPSGDQLEYNGYAWEPVTPAPLKYPIAIDKGGTNATTAAQARINLGIDPIIAGLLPINGSGAMTGVLKLADGTMAAPSLAWNSEPGLGLFRPQASLIGFAAGGQFFGYLNAGSAAQTSVIINPRTASGVAEVGVINQPNGSPNFNALYLRQQGDGNGLVQTVAAGSAVRGNLTLDAPTVIVPGTLNLSGDFSMWRDANANKFIQFAANWYWSWLGANGNLTWNRSGGPSTTFYATGDFAAGRDLFCGAGNEMALIGHASSGGFPKVRFTLDGWRLEWNGGVLTYFSPSNARSVWWDGSGNLNVASQGWKPGGGPWGDNSDERIKDAIADYTHGLDELLQLRPRTYQFKAATKRARKTYIGLVAQEVECAMPEMVTKADVELGDIHLKDMRQLDSNALTYALINAVKTLHERINQLEHA